MKKNFKILSIFLISSASMTSIEVLASPFKRVLAEGMRQFTSGLTSYPQRVMCLSPKDSDRDKFQKSLNYLYRNLPDEPLSEVDCTFNERLRNSQMMEQFNLSEAECMAIFAYTHLAYVELNQELRDNDGEPGLELLPFFRTLKDGLDKLPPYLGKVYRNTVLPSEEMEKLRVGATIENPSFMSATTQSISKIKLSMPGNHEFEISSGTARLVEALSLYPKEGEVIFKPGTLFEVVEIERNTSKVCIVLEEVENKDSE